MSEPQPYPPSTPLGSPVDPAAGVAASPAYPAYPGQASQAYPPQATGAVGGRNGLAVVAFILAVVSVALGLASTLLTRFVLIQMLYRLRLSSDAVTGYNIASQGILLLAFAATLIVGLLAIRSDRKLLAGIAIGVGGAGVINAIVSLIATAIASVL